MDPYPRLARYYDAMAWTLLLPFGGEDRLRQRSLDALELRPGMRVLELGCGTGAMTRRLLQRGCEVVAVERSPAMLLRARRRASQAALIEGDFLADRLDARFDRVLLSFVLHELDREHRLATLGRAARALRPGGKVGIVDFARPRNPILRALLTSYLRLAEPGTAVDWLGAELAGELRDAGLAIDTGRPLAAGTAGVTVATLVGEFGDQDATAGRKGR
jgi:demethylmenaquinone methyltransferase/2-methoxy-6-polyprenyl-1,4-benzoquinol methylase